MNDNEIWKPIEGYEGLYEVSTHGRVRSLNRIVIDSLGRSNPKRGVLLSANPGQDGYPSVALWSKGKPKSIRVHRLVAETFIPGEEPGLEVCHMDGARTNNHISNLRWDTRQGNVADMEIHGTNHFTNRTHCPQGHEYDSQNTIKFGRRRSCRACRNAHRRRRRAELSEPKRKREARDQKILEMHLGGKGQSEIAQAVGFTQAGVSVALARIKHRGVGSFGRDERPSQTVPYFDDDSADVEQLIDDYKDRVQARSDGEADRQRGYEI